MYMTGIHRNSWLRACDHCLGRSSSTLPKENLFVRQLKPTIRTVQQHTAGASCK